MREELDRILAKTDLWDERTQVLQVTDAVGGIVRVRVLVTAADAGKLFDLRCLVRERLVAWVRSQHEDGLPRQRVEMVDHDQSTSSPSRGATVQASSPGTGPPSGAPRASAPPSSSRTRRRPRSTPRSLLADPPIRVWRQAGVPRSAGRTDSRSPG